ncbi:MAG TPA: beta-N-acetylhexosaminidase [Rudaea sp.]
MLVIGIEGKELSAADRRRIAEPSASGVILFARNYASRDQLGALIAAIRTLRDDPFLIAIDQEGGPVQRLRGDGFTRLPALARIGERHANDPKDALALAEEHAWIMATEMRALDIDLSFAPVLDLARGNRIIGERSFHADPAIVSALGLAYVRGMRIAGMAATVKHFPGHGSVLEDTHVECAVDVRPLDAMRASDLLPFADASTAGADAVMMAHVTYPAVDPKPAGYSRVWIDDILRGELGFRGVVFSDDISMAAAESAGGIAARIASHHEAGCELILACQPAAVDEAIAAARDLPACPPERVAMLCGGVAQSWQELIDNPQRTRFLARLAALEPKQEPQS